MDDELRMLHEAMVVKDRLRVLAELQASYWEALLAQGFEPAVAEQLMVEWSRHAYGMTFRALPEPRFDQSFDDLLALDQAPDLGAQPAAPSGSFGDPSNVPPGEPWLQLVDDVDDAGSDEDRRAA